ncbi:MAG: M36 family metallopeptidase [Saprospiraceae bacterium]|nr:M36 family metallopeptidase [Saprospiraceae bacterium]
MADPLSAPNAGPSQLIADPSDADASLWAGDDGTTTYTITRGNNTHAFADPDSNYLSAGDEPTGGASLIFDYPTTLMAPSLKIKMRCSQFILYE